MNAHVSPLASEVYRYMRRVGHIDSYGAMMDLGIGGGSLTRRITELAEAGFRIKKTRKCRSYNGRSYTQYSLMLDS